MTSVENAVTVDPKRLAEWSQLQGAVAKLLDGIAGLHFDAEAVPALIDDIATLSNRLGAPESDPDELLCSLQQLPSRGRLLAPPFKLTKMTDTELEGNVLFGRRHLGRNKAAHGGVVAMLFDEVLGGLINRPDQPRCRTAQLTTNYRSITPIDTRLVLRATITEREGRKVHVCGELYDGETLCADAKGLFIVLRPGQP